MKKRLSYTFDYLVDTYGKTLKIDWQFYVTLSVLALMVNGMILFIHYGTLAVFSGYLIEEIILKIPLVRYVYLLSLLISCLVMGQQKEGKKMKVGIFRQGSRSKEAVGIFMIGMIFLLFYHYIFNDLMTNYQTNLIDLLEKWFAIMMLIYSVNRSFKNRIPMPEMAAIAFFISIIMSGMLKETEVVYYQIVGFVNLDDWGVFTILIGSIIAIIFGAVLIPFFACIIYAASTYKEPNS